MTVKSALRVAVNRLLSPLDLCLMRKSEQAVPPLRWTMEAALARVAALGVSPATLIDVGAASGDWARSARSMFPDTRCLLIEPISSRRGALDNLASGWPGCVVESVVAGESAGSVGFNITDDPDGSGVYGRGGGGKLVNVAQETIDRLVAKHALPGPYLLKLDTHGYELPIFRGAAATLEKTDLIVVEAYGFRPSPTAVRYWELCAWLHELGFTPVDLAGLMGRKRDGLFWQADLLLLRNDHPALAVNDYA